MTVDVTDLQGRAVRHLFDGRPPMGTMDLRWNLRDDYGSRVPPGIYFVGLRHPGYKTFQRVIVTGH